MPYATVADAPLEHALTLVGAQAQPATLRRLAELGLRPGAGLTVVRRTAGGGRIVAVAGSRIALDAATAAGLSVAERKVQAV